MGQAWRRRQPCRHAKQECKGTLDHAIFRVWFIAFDTMRISVVIPVCDEVDNVRPLAREIQLALAPYRPFEIIFVDDGSRDDTARAVLAAREEGIPEIRLLQHDQRCGQSLAIATGVRAGRAEWVATLDGDGQNDPADLRLLLQTAQENPRFMLVMGNRKVRKDNWLRRVSSHVANRIRSRLLRDGTPDTGCGIKVMHRQTYLQLPYFDHMHRFLPALFQRAGAAVISVPVRHRSRTSGRSKYGVNNRLWVGIVDLFGVRWLIRRAPARVQIIEQ